MKEGQTRLPRSILIERSKNVLAVILFSNLIQIHQSHGTLMDKVSMHRFNRRTSTYSIASSFCGLHLLVIALFVATNTSSSLISFSADVISSQRLWFWAFVTIASKVKLEKAESVKQPSSHFVLVPPLQYQLLALPPQHPSMPVIILPP
jgi:hypothetical protein